MNILQIHNLYNNPGGEDKIVENERSLLIKNGHDVRTLYFDNSAIRSFPYNNTSYRIVKQEILNFKPNVVHYHNIFYKATASAIKAAKDLNIPTVMTLHNYRLICPNANLLRDGQICTKCVGKEVKINAVIHRCFQDSAVKSALLSFALYKYKSIWESLIDRFICLTEFQKNLILNSEINLSSDKVLVKANSVPAEPKFNNRSGRKGYFVFVGRLSKEKGVQTMIEAFCKSRFRLKVIGDGPLRDQLTSIATDNIEFIGQLSNSQAIRLIGESLALVFPSIWYEGLPTTILESFSTGTPIIFSNIPNVNSIVSDGFNGISFEPNSAFSLNTAIEEFLQSKNDLYRNSLDTYHQHYTEEKNVRKLLEIYSDLDR